MDWKYTRKLEGKGGEYYKTQDNDNSCALEDQRPLMLQLLTEQILNLSWLKEKCYFMGPLDTLKLE